MTPIFDFSIFPTLETNRLRLRQIDLNDTNDMAQMLGDEAVTKYLVDWPDTTDVSEQTMAVIRWTQQAYAERFGIRWAITFKDEDRLIGTCGFHRWDRENFHIETGYDLSSKYWRRGVMTEAMRRILRFAFEQMGVHRVEADVTVGNEASAALLRKLGFTHEGTWRDRAYWNGRFYDLWQFGLLKDEFHT